MSLTFLEPSGSVVPPGTRDSDRVVRNSALNLTGQATYALCQLASIVILARALGAERFGQYYIVFALILVVQLIAEAGLSTILTSRLVRNPLEQRRIISEGMGLFVVVAALSAGVLVTVGLVWSSWRGDSAWLVVFAAAGAACAAIQLQRFGAAVLQAAERFEYENVARVLQGATFAALVFLLVASDYRTVHGVVLMLAASHWIGALFLLMTVHRRQRLAVPSWPDHWRDWLLEAGPLGFGDVIRSLTWQLDTLLLGLFQPAAVVGIYSVAYRPLGPLNWLPRAFLSASFPSFTRLAVDRVAQQVAFAESARLLTIVSVPIAVAIFVCAKPFVLLIAGPAFLEAAQPMRLLIWIAVFSFLTMHFRFLLVALGRARLYASLALGVLALEACIELALIPSWGYFGACAGSVGGELIFMVVAMWWCRREGIQGVEWKTLGTAIAAGGVMAVILWPVRDASLSVVLPLIVVAIGIYFALCVGLGALPKREVRRFGGALRRLLRPAALHQ